MSEILGWFTAALPVLVIVAITIGFVHNRGKRGSTSGGTIGMFDEVWAPSAAEARAIWDAEQELPIEVPSPDGGNPTEEALAAGRITITPRAGS
ncbi:hypothetical protein [Microbacterium sp. ZW T5_56]|uniref:hypothetical protein n=1 Tax=Microbacterium sp. ZW T5_56 TaxID=3378081 RepID=UPI0038554E51